MKKFIITLTLAIISFYFTNAQIAPIALNPTHVVKCGTMQAMDKAIKNDPTLVEKWKAEGEKRYAAYLQRQQEMRQPMAPTEIIIPIVFHIVDIASTQSSITDRDIYEQVEILNKDYKGLKALNYKGVIPAEIYNRLGNIPIRFVLAKRTPGGALTSGIERRINTSPDHISIKSFATGGLDAWDIDKYLNIWTGTFSGGDAGLLGISTFPFTTTEGPQGVVIGTFTLPYTSNVARSYYPSYSEGATLAHEIGHYFYLYHTFGDQTVCNNTDFRIQAGWPLPLGAGPEGDDTPAERAGPGNAYFGNPSQNYSDGCDLSSYGMMYGSYMNYFDDRALFMFSNGMRKRVEGCIELYRPGLVTSDGATPPSAVNDAYLVNITPRSTPERREFIINNTPLTVTIRNSGTSQLTSVNLSVTLDGASIFNSNVALTLDMGKDTTISAGQIAGAAGVHSIQVATSLPNNVADDFTNNDSIQCFYTITNGALTAPFTESFTSTTFPPAGWQIWNPQGNITWTRNATSGFSAAGSASVQNYSYNGVGQLDDLISPSIDLGVADSAILSFGVAHGVYDIVDVSIWDGLEVYGSADGGIHYQLLYKKTGNQLKTVTAAVTGSFTALPTSPEKWRRDSINLTPLIATGNHILLKFRNTNAYGNNTYLDDISVSTFATLDRDASPTAILNVPDYSCNNSLVPSVVFTSLGKDTLTSLQFKYTIDNGATSTTNWTGNLPKGLQDTVTLNSISGLAAGAHSFTVITALPNGLADQNVINDTIRKSFYVIGQVSLPVTEGFEGTLFPPANWIVGNDDGDAITWERTTAVASTGTGAMVIRNYDATKLNTSDKFISSIIKADATLDSIFVSFDYAYAPGISYPGTTADPLDTLEIQVSTDCGLTTTTVWKKWGYELQTIMNPNSALGIKYTPLPGEWKNIKLSILPYTNGGDFQVYFVAKSNKQNNLYIDNINIYGITVP
ncbi:MAG: choice-of-anchor J domain-containing protein, partial [Ginsengibacter sp.]